MTSAINTWVYFPDDEVELPAATSDFAFAAGVPSGWEFTRASTALGRSVNGRWTTYGANVPRPHYDPLLLQNQGMLIEPARTQLVISPRTLTATANEATFSTDTTTQTPFGLGGRLLIPTTVSAAHSFNLGFGTANHAAAIPDGSVVSLQFYFKPVGTFTRGIFTPQLKTGVFQAVEFTTAGGGAILSSTVESATISPDTDGFFRLQFTVNYGTGTTAGSANFGFRTADGVRIFAGDGTSGIFIAYYGAEIGPECTSPIIPAGGINTRSEDVLRSNAEWLRSGPKSFGLEYTPLSALPQVILGTDGLDNIELSTVQSGVVYSVTTPTGTVGPLSGPAPLPGVERTTLITAATDSYLLVQDGSLLSYSETGPLPNAITGMRIGARPAGGMAGPLLVREFKFWKDSLDRTISEQFSKDLSVPGVAPVLPVIDIQRTRAVSATDTSVVMTVTLTGAPTGASVSYRTINETATAGVDYTATTGTLIFGLGDNTAQMTVTLGTRSLLESRTFVIELYNPIDAVLGNPRCTVTLTKATPTAHAPLKLTTFNGPLTGDWVLTRSTPGYARNSAGIWTQVPADQPRIHYTSASDVGILIEPATTQCMFDSVTFGYTLNSTITNVTTVQTPTGMRMVRWRETAVTGNHLFRAFWNTTGATWPTGDFVLWGIIKPVGPRVRWRMAVKGIDAVSRNAIFTLSGNGAVVSTSSADVVARIEPEPLAPGWYRVGIGRPQAVSANVSAEFDIGPVDEVTNSNSLPGDVTYGLDICHYQCEPGLFWTSPIPVQAAIAATPRDADVLKASGSWFARSSFALGVKFKRLGPIPSSQRIVQFRDVAPSVDDFGILTVDGTVRAPLTTGAVFLGNVDGPVNATGSYSTAVVSIDTTRYSLFVGGALSGEIPMAGKDMPRTVQHVRFGSKEQDASQGAPIVIQTVGYWTVGLTNDEGTVFSTDLTGTPPGQVEPDPLPLVNVPAFISVPEGQSINIPVTKIGNGACSVNFRTMARTATRVTDYTGIGSTDPLSATAYHVDFAANESTKLVPFQTVADTDDEPNSEKVGIEISVYKNPPDCQIGNGVGEVTIVEAVKPPDSTTLLTRSKTFASPSNAGIGQPVYRVTSLKDDNTVGTLRYGINLGSRHIIFEVGGVIKMTQDWSFTKNDLTISGETAPYPGITLQGSDTLGGTFKPQASRRVHISHINFERLHDNRVQQNTNSDGVDLAPGSGTEAQDIEFRHCSFFWSNDEMISIWPTGETNRGFARRISFSDCMFCEPLYRPALAGNYQPHMEGGKVDPPVPAGHNYAFVIGRNSFQIDIQYCLFTDVGMRAPFIDSTSSVVLANNIALNSNKGAHISINDYTPRTAYTVTCVGYLAIWGPDSTASDYAGFKIHSNVVEVHPAGSIAWVDGLYSLKGPNGAITAGPTWDKVTVSYASQRAYMADITKVARPIDIPDNPVPKLSGADIRSRAIQNIGPHPKRRIPNVARKIKHLSGNTGKLVNHQSEVTVDGMTTIAQTNRALNGATAFSSTDPTIIPPYPTLSGSNTAADRAAVRAWLEFFLSRVQHD